MSFDPEGILRVLVKHKVDFVVIGGIAATLLGSATATFDVDICYRRTRENIERLSAALFDLKASLRDAPSDLPFEPDVRALAGGRNYTFSTRLGPLDCFGHVPGTSGYEGLAASADRVRLGRSTVLRASIDSLIAMKQAAGRGKDLIALEELLTIREMSGFE